MENQKNLFLPSFAAVLFLLLFLFLVVKHGNGLLLDTDTGYHIRTGELILQEGYIPKEDPFSFWTPPIKWTAHEWLSEIIMALLHRFSGLTGVVLFFAFLIALAYAILFKSLQNELNLFVALFIVFFAAICSFHHWFARPHIFSLLFVISTYCILDRYQYQRKNYLVIIPFLMILWANLHGGFIFGFVLIGVYLIGNLVKGFIGGSGDQKDSKKKAWTLGLLAIGCIGVSLINPQGYHLLIFPFKISTDKILMDHVLEFLPPNFRVFYLFRYFLLFLILVLALSKNRLNLIELLLILFFGELALYSARHVELFTVIAVPVVGRRMEDMVRQHQGKWGKAFKGFSNRIASIDRNASTWFWPVVVVTMAVLVSGKISRYDFNQEDVSRQAVEFLKREKISGRMFNVDWFGDYLIYTSWPEYRVFIDGRSDMYGSDLISDYLKVTRLKPDWEKTLQKYEIDWVIYKANEPLSLMLKEHPGWKLVYEDKAIDIFVKS